MFVVFSIYIFSTQSSPRCGEFLNSGRWETFSGLGSVSFCSNINELHLIIINSKISLNTSGIYILRALAASAPILQFQDITRCGDYNQVVTKAFGEASAKCVENIRKSWVALDKKGREGGETDG